MKKIIVFGATGKIGAYFVDYCNSNLNKKEFEIVAVGRKNTDFFKKNSIEYIQCDITNKSDFNLLPADNVYAIVNFTGILPAYIHEFNPNLYVNTNIVGSINILEYARKIKADRVLYTQTWAVQSAYWGKTEILSPTMPKNYLYTGDHAFYTITKDMIEESMKFYYQEYGIGAFVFRLPNVYLYNPNKSYYVDGIEKKIGYRYMIDEASKGHDIEMWGNPNSFKDVLYVKDLCQMMYKSMFVNKKIGVYNAGTGIRTSLKNQIEGIIEVFSPNLKSKIIERPDKSNYNSFVMDITNAKEELGYEPKYFYKEYLNDYKKEMTLKRFDELWMK